MSHVLVRPHQDVAPQSSALGAVVAEVAAVERYLVVCLVHDALVLEDHTEVGEERRDHVHAVRLNLGVGIKQK